MESMSAADGESVEVVEGVYLTQMIAGQRMSCQHVHIEAGARVPDHQHHFEQAGYIDEGTATFIVDGEDEFVVGAGESYVLPGHETHAVENRTDDPVTGVDFFAPPRDDPDWAP